MRAHAAHPKEELKRVLSLLWCEAYGIGRHHLRTLLNRRNPCLGPVLTMGSIPHKTNSPTTGALVSGQPDKHLNIGNYSSLLILTLPRRRAMIWVIISGTRERSSRLPRTEELLGRPV